MLNGVTAMNLATTTQQQMESRIGSLDVLGLCVLSNHLRHDSKDTIQHLQERYAPRSVVVSQGGLTGLCSLFSVGSCIDLHLVPAAMSVASDCVTAATRYCA